MTFTTLKKCDNLEYISNYIKTPIDKLSANILNFLFLNEMIEDGSQDWGKTLIDVLNENLSSPIGVATLCLKTNHPKIVEAFEKLTLFNVDYSDCPECGSDLEEKTFMEFGEKWTDKACENIHCNYYENNEPHFDESYEDVR